MDLIPSYTLGTLTNKEYSMNYFSDRKNTDLGKISISGEVETGKVHGETTVHVHVHISSGAGSAVVQVVLPKEKKIR